MLESPVDTVEERPVVVIGAAGIDMVGRLDDDLVPLTSNPASIRSSFGGVARNVAENLARLGQPVSLLAAVGKDPYGDRLLAHTRQTGVDVSRVIRSDEHRTGTYLAVVDHMGESQFGLHDMEVIELVSREYLEQNQDLFKNASALFVDANLPAKSLRNAMKHARKANIPVYADPTSTKLAGRLSPFLDRLAMIAPNSTEASVLCNIPFEASDTEKALHAAKCLVGEGVDLAIITLAEFGVTYASSRTSGYITALRTEIVDPTGAGDALTAAVIFAMLNDIQEDEAVRLGISAASLTLRQPGTVSPNLSLETLYDQLVV
jgi:pseudouridine kinase